MKRIAIIIPDTKTTKSVIEILRTENVHKEDISVIAKHRGELEEEVELTGVLAESTLGTMLGGATLATLGALVGLPVFTFAGGILIASSTALGAATLAAGFMAWLTSILGDDSDKDRIKDYNAAVEEGKILIIANVPDEKIPTISEQVREKNSNLRVENLTESKKERLSEGNRQ